MRAPTFLLFPVLAGCAGSSPNAAAPADRACDQAAYRVIEERVGSGDGRGHGPDVGSDEWKSVIEFRLGLRGSDATPPRESEAWCAYIEEALRMRRDTPAEKLP